jgi:hypothetical protein
MTEFESENELQCPFTFLFQFETFSAHYENAFTDPNSGVGSVKFARISEFPSVLSNFRSVVPFDLVGKPNPRTVPSEGNTEFVEEGKGGVIHVRWQITSGTAGFSVASCSKVPDSNGFRNSSSGICPGMLRPKSFRKLLSRNFPTIRVNGFDTTVSHI